MRKFFALALAVAMVLSLASVSFAAEDATAVYLGGPYRYDADNNVMINPEKDKVDTNDKPTDALRYGSGVYYLIKLDDYTAANNDNAEANAVATGKYAEIEKLKVKAEFEMGEELVESVSIVKKYVDATAQWKDGNTDTNYDIETTDGVDTSGYYYFVEVKVADKDATSGADIVGTLEFNRKADKDVDSTNTPANKVLKIKDAECEIEFTVFYQNNYNIIGKLTGDKEDLKWDTDYALKFENDDVIELSFGSDNDGNNEGTFNVDVSGQGKVFLNYNTKADEAIVAANPGVKMFFLNFNNCKFNRVGEFVYEMDDIAAAYKVVDGQLVEIKGAEMDVDAVSFNTRVLESYVFADAELVNPAAAVEAPVVEAPAAVTNPSTGA